MPSAVAPAVKQTAFLDTNALVFLYTYWEFTQVARIRMDTPKDFAELRKKVEARIKAPVALAKDDYANADKGMACFGQLNRRRADYVYWISAVNRSELRHVVLNALARDRMGKRRVPYLVSVKRPLVVHKFALDHSNYSDVSTKTDDFFESLRTDFGWDLRIAEEDPAGSGVTIQSILDTAEKIWSRILLEILDAYVFAAAFEVGADVVLTSDTPLRLAIGNVRNPPADWKAVSQSIRIALGASSKKRPLPSAQAPEHPLP